LAVLRSNEGGGQEPSKGWNGYGWELARATVYIERWQSGIELKGRGGSEAAMWRAGRCHTENV